MGWLRYKDKWHQKWSGAGIDGKLQLVRDMQTHILTTANTNKIKFSFYFQTFPIFYVLIVQLISIQSAQNISLKLIPPSWLSASMLPSADLLYV